jgi:hypothetical protein
VWKATRLRVANDPHLSDRNRGIVSTMLVLASERATHASHASSPFLLAVAVHSRSPPTISHLSHLTPFSSNFSARAISDAKEIQADREGD